MASPAYVGCDQYGVDVASPTGDWPTSRTLAVPSFAADTCIVALVADYVSSSKGLDHWAVPASWTHLGEFGLTSFSGLTNNAYVYGDVFQCAPGDVAATVRPETSANTLHTPTAAATWQYWRAFVTGWTPTKLWDPAGTGNLITGIAGSSQSTIPGTGWGSNVSGLGEGTFVQVTAGNLGYGGGPTGVSAANGFSDEYSAGQFRVASQQFAVDTTTPGAVYTKTTGSFRIGASLVVALDTPPRPRGFRHAGIVRGARG